jgi:chromosome segregation ATPase
MLRGTLSNFKSIDSGNVSSNIHFLGSEINLILKFDGCGHTDLIESHKVAIKQQTDELHNYCIQIEAEKEKSKITASEISVLKSEVVNFSGTMHNHCEHVTGLKPRNSSTEVDLSLQLDTLKVTIEDLLRQSMWSEKKIAELQEIKYTSERILNKTIDRIKDELNVLKTELENTKSELGCSQEIVKKKNYEKKCLMEKNESLTHDIDNLYKSLRDLKSEYFLSKEKSKENSKDKINDLEHESDRNYLHLQRIEEQGQDAAADIVIMAKNLNRLKRQNTALDLSIENILRPSIKTIDETKSYPNFGHLLSEQCGCGTSVCSMFDMALGTTIQHQNKLKMDGYSSDDDDNIPKCEKDEKIKKLQNKLNELEKAYISKAQRYEKIITKIDIEARKEKEYQQQIYKSNMKIKGEIFVL